MANISHSSYCICKSCYKLDDPSVAFLNLPKDPLISPSFTPPPGNKSRIHGGRLKARLIETERSTNTELEGAGESVVRERCKKSKVAATTIAVVAVLILLLVVASFRQRSKWGSSSPFLAIGVLVFIKEDHQPPCKWVIGRISEVHPGVDGIARVFTLKTARGLVRRPIAKICPLPIDHEIVDAVRSKLGNTN
ncbi:hypothetical protein Trydic_g12791 [Trypoxylus dichotomus]